MRFSRIVTLSLSTLFLLPIVLQQPVSAQQASPSLTATSKEDPKTTALKKQIQGFYNEMDRASERFDFTGMFKYAAKDCKYYMRDGKKASVEFVKENWQMIYRRAVQAKIQTEISTIVVKNDTATIGSFTKAQVRVKGDDGLMRDIDVESHSRDFWMKVKGNWVMKQTRENDRTIKVNGQIIEE